MPVLEQHGAKKFPTRSARDTDCHAAHVALHIRSRFRPQARVLRCERKRVERVIAQLGLRVSSRRLVAFRHQVAAAAGGVLRSCGDWLPLVLLLLSFLCRPRRRTELAVAAFKRARAAESGATSGYFLAAFGRVFGESVLIFFCARL